MPCRKCGARTQNGDLCPTHRIELKHGDRRTDGGYEANPDQLVHDCTSCDTRYRGVGACPDCGSQRRRFVRHFEPGDGKLREAQ